MPPFLTASAARLARTKSVDYPVASQIWDARHPAPRDLHRTIWRHLPLFVWQCHRLKFDRAFATEPS